MAEQELQAAEAAVLQAERDLESLRRELEQVAVTDDEAAEAMD